MIDLVQILDILCMQVIKKDDVFLCPFSCVLGVKSEKKNGETGRKKYPEKQGQWRDERSYVDVTIVWFWKKRYCKKKLSPEVADATANLKNFNG